MITSWKSKNENLIPLHVTVDELRAKELAYQTKIGKPKKETHKACGRSYWFINELTEEDYKKIDSECICRHPEQFENIDKKLVVDVCFLGHTYVTDNFAATGNNKGRRSITIKDPCHKCKRCKEIFSFNDETRLDIEISEETKKTLKGLNNIAKAQAGMKYGFK